MKGLEIKKRLRREVRKLRRLRDEADRRGDRMSWAVLEDELADAEERLAWMR